jgi:hypothetical protein
VRVRLPRIFGVVLRNPRDTLCAVVLMLAVSAIVTNGLYLQPGRHPAPIFTVRPLPVIADETTAVAAQVPSPVPRPAEAGPPKSEPPKSEPPKSEPPKSEPPKSEPPRSEQQRSAEQQRSGPSRSGPARPEPGIKTEPGTKTEPVPLPRPRAQSALAARADVAADAASPAWQVSAVQRTLNQAGYGPIRVSGILDDSTREGIARFERDHNLPITGQNTRSVRHALAAATGRWLD